MKHEIVVSLVWMSTFAYVSANLSDNCMKCICEVEGCENNIGRCNWDVGSLSCGPYQIKEPYYVDCGRPGGGWQPCTKYMNCSETCVRAYMARYAARCQANPTCQTYAMVHNGGPTGCRNPRTVAYWGRVNACCQRLGGC